METAGFSETLASTNQSRWRLNRKDHHSILNLLNAKEAFAELISSDHISILPFQPAHRTLLCMYISYTLQENFMHLITGEQKPAKKPSASSLILNPEHSDAGLDRTKNGLCVVEIGNCGSETLCRKNV
jgi:hypothetical protein